MAYDSLSSQQQELLDLLRNEIAEYVGNEPNDLWGQPDNWCGHFEYLSGQLEHLARAAQMVGLQGFGLSCERLVTLFSHIAGMSEVPALALQAQASRWSIVFLGYLQRILADGFVASASEELLVYLRADEWPVRLTAEQCKAISEAFDVSEVIVDDGADGLQPSEVTAEHASLDIPADVHPELLDGLITELPIQSEAFSSAIDHYIHTNDASYLLTAQRVAHTIKGAGNVVGISGVANLMHYCEDLLETHHKGIDVGGGEFSDLLLDTADGLANISDFLQGFAPAPENIQVLLVALITALLGDAVQPLLAVEVEEEAPAEESAFFAGAGEEGLVEEVDDAFSEEIFSADLAEGLQDLASDLDTLLADDVPDEGQIKEVGVNQAPEVIVEDAARYSGLDGFTPDTPKEPLVGDALLFEEKSLLKDGLLKEGQLLESDDLLSPDDLFDTDLLDSDNIFDVGALTEIDSLIDAEPSADAPDEGALIVQEQDELVGDAQVELSQDLGGELKLVPNAPTPQVDLDSKPQFNLTIPDEKATELLRVAGEIQISNTQIQSRVDSTLGVVSAAVRFQHQLLDLAAELEKSLTQQSASFIAMNAGDDSQMDPLELERYNELHSFASRLQEVTTDAHEAVRDTDQSLVELQDIITDQRQLGFEMQNQVLSIRLLPASVLSSRFTRGVRQAARSTNKAAILEIIGDDVLVDSRVLNSIADPVLHLLRNAVDHGLESSAAQRRQADKSAEGKITLTFERVGETIRVRVSDDGQGIDYRAVERLAIERGIITSEKSHTDSELERVILMPGFSTRSAATQTSGRGIGLDVVNDQVRQLKGHLNVNSKQGLGTTFELSMPMSVLSAHMLMVSCEGQMHGVISRGLQQIAYLLPKELLQDESGQWIYDLYGERIPVFFLNQMTGVGGGVVDASQFSALLITPKADGQLCGVAVEQIVASEEHVVKPLSRFSFRPVGVTGAAILGSGAIAPVLDIHDFPELRFTLEERKHWQDRTALLGARKNMSVAVKPVALVVDDSLSARRAVAQFMADFGYEVVAARDGFDAINQMAALPENKTPSIALLDLEMPRMNGLELAAHMRSQPLLRQVPIAMITSRTTARHKVMAENAGVGAYLNKPWSDDELMQVLADLLPQPEQVVGG